MADWQKIYTTLQLSEANIIQGMLEENQIPVRVMNKQDSSYLNFGEIELYVPGHLLHTARELMNKGMLN